MAKIHIKRNKEAKILVLGLGQIAIDHLAAIKEIENGLGIKTIIDSGSPKPEAKQAVQNYCSNAELIENASSDTIEEYIKNQDTSIVAIFTPPQPRFELAKAALNAGKDVVLEKPATQSVEQLLELLTLAKKKNCHLVTAYHAREIEPVLETKKILKEKTLKHVQIIYQENASTWHGNKPWIFSSQQGGVISDSGINAISALMYTLPNQSISITDSKVQIETEELGEIRAAISFQLEKNKVPGHITLDWKNPKEKRQIYLQTSDSQELLIDVVDCYLAEKQENQWKIINGPHAGSQHAVQYPIVWKQVQEARLNDFPIGDARVFSSTPLQFVEDAHQIASKTIAKYSLESPPEWFRPEFNF